MPEYKINELLNGIEIYFETKPNDNILSRLKNDNWRWHPSKRCWYKAKSDESLVMAIKICSATNDEPFMLGDTSEHIVTTVNANFVQKLNGEVISHAAISKNGEGFSIESTNNMIICVDCQRFFSIHATVCPFCGCPLKYTAEVYYNKFCKPEVVKKEDIVKNQKLTKRDFLNLSENQLYKTKRLVFEELPKDFIRRYRPYWTVQNVVSVSEEELQETKRKADIFSGLKDLLLEDIDEYADRRYDEEYRRKEIEVAAEALPKSTSCKVNWQRCVKCGAVIAGEGTFCCKCDPYIGLGAMLDKLKVNMGAFGKNAQNLAPFMRPIGVPDYAHERFVRKLDDDPTFYAVEAQAAVGQKYLRVDRERDNRKIEAAIRDKYIKIFAKMRTEYTIDEIYGKYDLFLETAVVMKLCGEVDLLNSRVSEYAYRNYEEYDT